MRSSGPVLDKYLVLRFTQDQQKQALVLMVKTHSAALIPPSMNGIPEFREYIEFISKVEPKQLSWKTYSFWKHERKYFVIVCCINVLFLNVGSFILPRFVNQIVSSVKRATSLRATGLTKHHVRRLKLVYSSLCRTIAVSVDNGKSIF